jgi:deoxyuridine 5'-triphosphate nucleotidohydrolase
MSNPHFFSSSGSSKTLKISNNSNLINLKKMKIQLKLSDGVNAPIKATEFAAGIDIRANMELFKYDIMSPEYTIIHNIYENPIGISVLSRGMAVIPTGISIAIPEGYHIDIRPRSGLAAKYGVSLVNTPGLIDSDYRGDLGIILINHGDDAFDIKHGDRIAQIVLMKHETIEWENVETLPDSVRGEGGFGSTGK